MDIQYYAVFFSYPYIDLRISKKLVSISCLVNTVGAKAEFQYFESEKNTFDINLDNSSDTPLTMCMATMKTNS